MKRIITAITLAVFGLFFLPAPVQASETVFEYQLDYFELSGNGLGTVSDDFDDGDLNPFHILYGTATEHDGVVSLTNPGAEQPLPGYPSIIMERSDIIAPTPYYIYDTLGDFVAESIWAPIAPEAPGGYYAMSLVTNIAPGTQELMVIAVANLSTTVAKSMMGGAAKGGLQILQLRWDYEYNAGIFGDGIIVEADQYLFDLADLTGDIHLDFAFNDTTNEVQTSFSLDGGTVFLTPFSPMSSSIVEGEVGNWLLSADPMHVVPEPSSLAMLTCGLVGLGVVGRKRTRK